MYYYIEPVRKLIEALCRLPGIGPRTAERLAFHLLKTSKEEVENLADALSEAKEKVGYCSICNNLTELDHCKICSNGQRDSSLICVVEQPSDVIALEKSREYRGLYHVLLGSINPLANIGPDDIRLKGLIDRLHNGKVNEVIVATNPSTEGETTALYIAKLIKPLGIKITRIARGIPFGSSLEYMDEVTLGRALEGRREL